MNTALFSQNKSFRAALAVWAGAGALTLACVLPAPFVAHRIAPDISVRYGGLSAPGIIKEVLAQTPVLR